MMRNKTAGTAGGRANVVIIGNGIAGMTAAIEARRLAPDLSVAVITDQNHPTINTPVLKQFTVGMATREQLLAYPSGTEYTARLEMIHSRVVRIEATSSTLVLSNGADFAYDALLVATGSRPLGLPSTLPGSDLDGVLALHRLRDYLDLVRRLQVGGKEEVREVVVVGGGVHAGETVMCLRKLGLVAHWLIRGDRFYRRMFDERASELALDYFQQAGAQVWLQTELVGIIGSIGVVTGVVTTRHSYLPCQLVLVCAGSEPSTALADACDPPIATGRGIVVDERLATSVPAIYAAGDVAALTNPWTARHETRQQWAAAVEQGRYAASVLTGQSTNQEAGLLTPWHATALGDLALLTVGMLHLSSGTEALVHEHEGGYYRLIVDGDRLVGYLALAKHLPDGAGIKRLLDEGIAWSEAAEALLTGTFDARSFFLNHHTSFLLQQENNPRLHVQGAAILQEHRRPRSAVLPGTGSLGQQHGRGGDGHRFAHRPWPQLEQEVSACIGCNECLLACPALEEPIPIDVLNHETLSGPQSRAVIRFTQACFQCGACVAPCPVGLHRDAMMLWMRVRLLRREEEERPDEEGLYARS